jgi:ribosomal protein S18 acetylase RimI-like enzyme
MALEGGNIQAMQQFIGQGRWQDEKLLQKHWQLVDETLGEDDAVYVVGESAFPKKGEHSVGVARQWCGVLERGIRAAEGLAFVWTDGGDIAGFVCAHDVGFLGYLSVLVVAEEARGRRIGRQLVRQVEREMAARDCAVLISDVWKGAEGFYRALGWTSPGVVLLRQRLKVAGG